MNHTHMLTKVPVCPAYSSGLAESVAVTSMK